jgi:lysophospholipase L1-like esterase
MSVDHYILRRATDAGFTTGVTDIDVGNVTSYDDDDAALALGVNYYYKVEAVDNIANHSGFSSSVAGAITPPLVQQEAVGRSSGGTVAGWAQNTIFSNGSLFTYSSGSIDRTGLINSATDEVYYNLRYTTTPGGHLDGTITGLTPDTSYLIRCHYYARGVAPAIAEMVMNSVPVAEITYNPDNQARIQEYYVTSDGSGEIAISQTYVSVSSFINGLQVFLADPPADAVTKQVVFVGDSLFTAFPNWGDSVAEQLAVLRSGNAYNQRAILRFDPANTMRTRSVALPGDTVSGMDAKASNLDSYYDGALSANDLVILIGHNDLAAGTSAATIEGVLGPYVTARQGTGWRTWIATVPPGTDITAGKETARLALNTYIRSTYPTRYIEFALNAALDDPSDMTYFYTDGVHNTTAGKATMSAAVHAAVPS